MGPALRVVSTQSDVVRCKRPFLLDSGLSCGGARLSAGENCVRGDFSSAPDLKAIGRVGTVVVRMGYR
jgi:hypothetical protein